MRARKELVESLLSFSEPLHIVMQELKQHSWDSACELAELTPEHIENILNLYLSGDISEHDVEIWANAIEQRDDIGAMQPYADVLAEMVFWLANPTINYAITPSLANRIIKNLNDNVVA